MSSAAILVNGAVVSSLAPPQVVDDGAVAWDGVRIVDVGKREDVLARHPEATRIDAHGGLILPGFVNLHHHFYSALARGLDPGAATPSFDRILEELWWRLDRALDMDTVRLSALESLVACIRWGTTTVFDHHASPSCIGGSLETIAEAVNLSGVRAALCYEITDRNGHAGAVDGLEENLEFLSRHQQNAHLRGLMGLHASFTVADDTLADVARRRPAGIGCHIHLAEDPMDGAASLERFGAAPVARLLAHGLLDDTALLAHGIHLEEHEVRAVAEHGATLIHNPESNQNNGVGRLDLIDAQRSGCAVGLGTDGMSSNVLRSLRCAFLGLRGGRRDPTVGYDAVPRLLAANRDSARRVFDEPLLGELVPGAPADMAVIDAPAPTSISSQNLFGHLLYGASESPVRHTVARGRILMNDFHLTTLDPESIAAEAREATPGLWKRFRGLAPLEYLG